MSEFEYSAAELSSEWAEEFQALVNRACRIRQAVLDGVCEAALISGEFGVRVDGNSISLTRDVPFGEIHYGPAPPG